jgi:integrase
VALLTGARRGEVCRIRAQDIGETEITIPRSHTKKLKPKVVPIVAALRPHLASLPLTIGYEGVKTGFRRAREAVGMEHVNFHDLRHSCASILLGAGVDLYTISRILGHGSVTTTQRYAHLQVEQQRAALEKLGNLVLKPGAA